MIRQLISAFHRTRRMWVYHRGTLMIAPPGTEMSHDEWFCHLGLDDDSLGEARDQSTRGYVLNSDIHAYSGDFNTSPQVRMDLTIVVPMLAALLQLSPCGHVHAGAQKGAPGYQWPPTETLDQVGDYAPVPPLPTPA